MVTSHPTRLHPTELHPTELQLERGHAGEPVSAAVTLHLSSCPECSQLVRELERDRELLLASESPGQFASRLQRAALHQPTERWTLRKLRLGLGSSVALAGTLAGTLAMAAIVAGKVAHWGAPSGPEQAGPTTTPATPEPDLGASRTRDAAAPDGMAVRLPQPPPLASASPRELSMQAGNRLLAIDPSLRRYRVHIPEEFAQRMGTGERISPVIDLCVSAQGSVQSVTIVTGSIAAVDAQIPQVLSRWRYRPYLVDGRPEPFCYRTRYSIEAR